MCQMEGEGDKEQKKWTGRERAGEKGNWREKKGAGEGEERQRADRD